MPDKESEMVDFIGIDQLEFLKRKSVYHPELGFEIGAYRKILVLRCCTVSCVKRIPLYLKKKRVR